MTPKDPFTAFSVGRLPAQPLDTYARPADLAGVRIGVIREYMDVRLFSKRDEEVIGVVDRAVADLKKTGATIVDPGAGGALFTACFQTYVPQAFGKLFTRHASGAVSRRRQGPADGRPHREARRD